MKREAAKLLEKAFSSLILAIEIFNRPSENGRVTASLIMIDHSFEMFLKSAILHKGGNIRERRSSQTIGFDACLRRGLTDGGIQFLSQEQVLILQGINGLRDAAQHYLLEISEEQLYLHIQSGVTLAKDLLRSVFGKELCDYMPKRVLPVSTSPISNIEMLFDSEIGEVEKLLRPGRRKKVEAEARLRPLAILDATMRGEKTQPTSAALGTIERDILKGKPWQEIFPGAAAIEIVPDGSGPLVSLRLSKKEGVPVKLVPEGTPGASVIAVKRVNELDYYSMGAKQIANKVGLSVPRAVAVIEVFKIREDPKYYKSFYIGKSEFKRYSQLALEYLREILSQNNVDEIWNAYRASR